MTMTFNPDAAANDKKKTDTFNPLAQFDSRFGQHFEQRTEAILLAGLQGQRVVTG